MFSNFYIARPTYRYCFILLYTCSLTAVIERICYVMSGNGIPASKPYLYFSSPAVVVAVRRRTAALRCFFSGQSVLMHRPIGRYRRSKHSKSLTSFNTTRHLLCDYFQLRTAHCLCNRNCRLMLGLMELVEFTGALPATKPEATAIWIIARWLLENNLNV